MKAGELQQVQGSIVQMKALHLFSKPSPASYARIRPAILAPFPIPPGGINQSTNVCHAKMPIHATTTKEMQKIQCRYHRPGHQHT